jgi:hypothetical protein
VCSRRKKCCWNEERERGEGGGTSQRQPQMETSSSQGFLFPALLNDVRHFPVSNDKREFQ